MVKCAHCGAELAETDLVCTECGERLGDEPLALVFETTDEGLADAVLATLEGAGIPVAPEFDRASRQDGLDLGILHGPYTHILTLESRAAEAKKLIADFVVAYERGQLAISEEVEPEAEE